MKDVSLIATLPDLDNENAVVEVFKNPHISEARYNVGAISHMGVMQTLEFLKNLSNKYGKKIWIDIKGRQTRVAKWNGIKPKYGFIELNHCLKVSYPAVICLRGDKCYRIIDIEDNKVFVDTNKMLIVGEGQSVNILADDVNIEGYLTDADIQYLQACEKLGMNDIMASFVESFNDFSEILRYLPKANVVAKIESPKGVNFISEYEAPISLMAARDDLYIETRRDYKTMYESLQKIIIRDPNAILASRIFTSLKDNEIPEWSDYADLALMYQMGYRHFMLDDNVCNFRFRQAIAAWEVFLNA